VSQINWKTSDTLCRLSTGGCDPHYRGPGSRPCASHTRPIVLNSIVNCVARPDLADRALFVALAPIKDKARKKEQELQAKFEKAWPRILGALLDGVAAGLDNIGCNRVENIGRMVDMHQFVSGCEKAYWKEGTFGSAYRESRERVAAALTEANPVATGVIQLIEEQGSFSGTATDLLRLLNAQGRDIHTRVKLPGGPAVLSGELTRVEPLLEAQGILVDHGRGGQQGARLIFISRLEPPQAKNRSRKPHRAAPQPAADNPQGLLPLGLTDDTDNKLEPA
jgi:putative DNA primase/helicase